MECVDEWIWSVILTRKTEGLGQKHVWKFVRHKSHTDRPEIQPRPSRWQAGDKPPEPLHGRGRQTTGRNKRLIQIFVGKSEWNWSHLPPRSKFEDNIKGDLRTKGRRPTRRMIRTIIGKKYMKKLRMDWIQEILATGQSRNLSSSLLSNFRAC